MQQFGGDPFNIGIAGQGSGAVSVSYHLINSRARGKIITILMYRNGNILYIQYSLI